jgi:hypothetical protein
MGDVNGDADLLEGIGEYQYGFKDPETYVFKSRKGLDREVVERKVAPGMMFRRR